MQDVFKIDIRLNITVEKTDDGWIAYKTNDSTIQEFGKTYREAVDKLMISLHFV